METQMATWSCVTNYCSVQKLPQHPITLGLSSPFKPILRGIPRIPLQIDASKTFFAHIKTQFLNAVVGSAFEFVDQLVLPSQSNFAPVEELGEALSITHIEGHIPHHFPQGVYIRNGSNPLFGGLKSSKSIFGRTNSAWVEGEGMLHALYFKRESEGCCSIVYNKRYVETETYKLEKQSTKPLFLPAVKGDTIAVLSSMLLNALRFGQLNKDYSNTNVFEHSGKFYSVSENHIPQEIDIFTLDTLRYWHVNEAWNRPFASHPKKVPGTGELVIFGVDATKPYLEVGIVSADGKELVRKEDIKLERCSLCHDIGITSRYIAILDFPLIVDSNRLFRRGPLIKYEKEKYARIGIMPLYGDANSIHWFEVEPNTTFHIINSFEEGHEVVLWGCRALDSIIPGPEDGLNDSNLFSRCYEWRLNMKSGEVKERYLTEPEQFMDFPVINASFTGIKNKYAYTQVVDPTASYAADIPKYGALAKLYFGEPCSEFPAVHTEAEEPIRVEYHKFERNVFCSGSAFVPKEGGLEEDDGWIITFIHNEETGISQVHIVDTKKFSGEAVAKITLPCRVPYGFHVKLSKFEDTETLRLVPKCKRVFHMNCINNWFGSHSTCPLCRSKVEEGDIKNLNYSLTSRFLRFVLKSIFVLRSFWEKHAHMMNHKIVVSDVFGRSRWSDLNSLDLLSLNCEMLSDMCSRRNLNLASSSNEEENSFMPLNPSEKRCMSEIVNVPRFAEMRERRENERLWSVWWPIARRTVQWFAKQERDSIHLQHSFSFIRVALKMFLLADYDPVKHKKGLAQKADEGIVGGIY